MIKSKGDNVFFSIDLVSTFLWQILSGHTVPALFCSCQRVKPVPSLANCDCGKGDISCWPQTEGRVNVVSSNRSDILVDQQTHSWQNQWNVNNPCGLFKWSLWNTNFQVSNISQEGFAISSCQLTLLEDRMGKHRAPLHANVEMALSALRVNYFAFSCFLLTSSKYNYSSSKKVKAEKGQKRLFLDFPELEKPSGS